MAIYWKGDYIGTIEANAYTVKELQDAGFTVVIK
jgi:hypothetical protein